jgi:hypothetical protein
MEENMAKMTHKSTKEKKLLEERIAKMDEKSTRKLNFSDKN